jgi:hypothetical protein
MVPLFMAVVWHFINFKFKFTDFVLMYVHVKYFVSSVPAAANSLENFIRSNRFPSLQKKL